MLMLIITEIFEIRNLKIVFFFQYFPHLLLQMIGIACIHSTMFCSGSVRLSQVVKDAATLHGLELGEEVGVGFRHRSLLLHLHIAFNIIGTIGTCSSTSSAKSSSSSQQSHVFSELVGTTKTNTNGGEFCNFTQIQFSLLREQYLRRCLCDNLLSIQNW